MLIFQCVRTVSKLDVFICADMEYVWICVHWQLSSQGAAYLKHIILNSPIKCLWLKLFCDLPQKMMLGIQYVGIRPVQWIYHHSRPKHGPWNDSMYIHFHRCNMVKNSCRPCLTQSSQSLWSNFQGCFPSLNYSFWGKILTIACKCKVYWLTCFFEHMLVVVSKYVHSLQWYRKSI